MSWRGNIKAGFALLMALMLSVACSRRPLEEMNDGLYLKLNLNLDVHNLDKPHTKPELMRVLFYDPDTYEFVSDDYVGPDGGYISAQPGRYKMVVYNFDTEATIIRGESSAPKLEAYTNEIPSATRTNLLTKLNAASRVDYVAPSETEKIVYEPDHLFVAREDVEIFHRTGTQTIHAAAHSIVETYYLGVRLQGGKNMASAQALLSGQAAGNNFGFEGGMIEESVILYFDMMPGTDENGNEVLETTFNTFGKLPKEISHLWLTVVVTNNQGDVEYRQWDITDEFKDNPEKWIFIEEDPIVLPDPPPSTGGGGGFQPSVDEWENVEQDVII